MRILLLEQQNSNFFRRTVSDPTRLSVCKLYRECVKSKKFLVALSSKLDYPHCIMKPRCEG